MNAFWHVWNAITPYGLVAFLILAAVALIITAASAGRLTDHWLGLRVGAPRDRVNDLLTKHEQQMHDELRLAGKLPVPDGLSAITERLFPGTTDDRFGDRYDWQAFVHGHDWPVNCAQCIWWIPAPSEAEDCIAVYQPCKAHEKQHQERRSAE